MDSSFIFKKNENLNKMKPIKYLGNNFESKNTFYG